MLSVAIKNLIIHSDPLGHYPDADPTPEQLIKAAGFLPIFIGIAFQESPEDTAEKAVAMYRMGGWSHDPLVSFTEEGVMQSQGDPDLWPMLAICPGITEQAEASNVKTAGALS